MICIFSPSFCSASRASRASAGGQLEQPSEVNNSTTTGERAGAGRFVDFCVAGGRINAMVAERQRRTRVEPANRCFIGAVSLPPWYLIRGARKSYRRFCRNSTLPPITVVVAFTGYCHQLACSQNPPRSVSSCLLARQHPINPLAG